MTSTDDTIYAVATATGKAGVAMVRVSGPAAGVALLALAPGMESLPTPRMAVRADLYAAESNGGSGGGSDRDRIDDALAVYFQAPSSFTGEDVVEFHIHGGLAVVDALLTSLAAQPGLRPAGPGEFSRRAFENGKMDLTSVEAIADLVDAETAAQRRQALTQMGGALADLYDGWRARLVGSMAYAEASIDFSEEDIPDDLYAQALETLDGLIVDIEGHLADNGIGERIRDGFRIALTGAPNVGKSSLLNALAKRDVAIVSDIAGTTRDVIEVPMDLGGFAATLVDTAGLRDSDDRIEQEGVRRAQAQAAAADIRLRMVAPPLSDSDIDDTDDGVLVINKIDVGNLDVPEGAIGISAKTGAGLDDLVAALTERLGALSERRASETPPLTRARHRHALEMCLAALRRARQGAAERSGSELVAEDMRLAAQALGQITGRIDVEDLLDKIFRDFCIGK